MNRSCRPRSCRRDESGQISILLLGLSLILILLITGTVAVTSAQLSRMRLLDVSDAAALSAANAFSQSGYRGGLREDVPLDDAGVAERAGAYVASRELPSGIRQWRIDSPTGSPDGRTAEVTMSADVDLPLIGSLVRELGGTLTITVTSHARATVLTP